VGVDVDPEALAALAARGLEGHRASLLGPDVTGELMRILDGRRLASISFLDGLEHFADGADVLSAMSRLMSEHRAAGVISVPNVTHLDVATKAVLGEWEYTDAGLLDSTHVRLFSGRSLAAALRAAGLGRIASRDVVLARSDQHQPADHAGLSERTSFAHWLNAVRGDAEPHGQTNQFVWALGPVPAQAGVEAHRDASKVFLSVLMRTQGRRPQELREALLCLAAQTCQDFEVLLVAHRTTRQEQVMVERLVADQPPSLRSRIRLILLDEGGRTAPLNLGLREAHGRYVSIFDDDDLVLAHWVEAFAKAEQGNEGRVLRGVALRQDVDVVDVRGRQGVRALDAPHAVYDLEFSLAHHLVRNQTPPLSFAFPRSLHVDFGLAFDEELSTTEDWDFLLRAAQLTGVTDIARTIAVYQWWTARESSRTLHSEDEWGENYSSINRLIDSRPLLLPAGETGVLRRDLGRLRRAEQIVGEQQDLILELHRSYQKTQDQLRADLEAALTRVHRLNTIVANRDAQLAKIKTRLKRAKANAADAGVATETEQPKRRRLRRLRRDDLSAGS
ncbi:glycosyltransferase family 2 protein, partial [Nocardioides sp. 616]|uniref:glycosyltransferase family 2 protein n=1 Tax=Nocardioides sp. 616 TaxID=2268090 RepID=UPI000CE2EB26